MKIKDPFAPAEGAEPAQWIVDRLTDFAVNVLSLVPSGFEAYARVFHPAFKMTCTADGGAETVSEPLRWSEVAELTGRTPHKLMLWSSIQGANPSLHDYTVLKVGDAYVAGPKEGSLPLEVAQALWPVLELHTTTRNRCFFAIWEGFGCLPRPVLDTPAFEIPARKFHLFTGPLEAIEESFCTNDPSEARTMSVNVLIAIGADTPSPEELEEALKTFVKPIFPVDHQSAILWWPEDRAWCVHTEIDLNTTYVAGSQRLVNSLLGSEELEAYQVEPTDELVGDRFNPLPDDPYGSSFKIE